MRHARGVADAMDALLDSTPVLLLLEEPLDDADGCAFAIVVRRLPGGDQPAVVVVSDRPRVDAPEVDRWVHPTVAGNGLVAVAREASLARNLPAPMPRRAEAVDRGSPTPAPTPAATSASLPAPPPAAPHPPPRSEPREYVVQLPRSDVSVGPVSGRAEVAARLKAAANAPRASEPPPVPPAPAPSRARSDATDGLNSDVRARLPTQPAPRMQTIPAAMQLSPQARDRLAHEVRVVEQGDIWTALGVPRDSSEDLIARAAERMQARYAPYLTGADAHFRDLARRMLARVEVAREQALERARGRAAPARGADPLGDGRALVVARRWHDADAWFSAARDHEPDNAEILGLLGWSRWNNPRLGREERESDGRAFMELAVQFEPTLADIHVRLGQIAQKEGRVEAARARARLALRASPKHPEAASLLRALDGSVA